MGQVVAMRPIPKQPPGVEFDFDSTCRHLIIRATSDKGSPAEPAERAYMEGVETFLRQHGARHTTYTRNAVNRASPDWPDTIFIKL